MNSSAGLVGEGSGKVGVGRFHSDFDNPRAARGADSQAVCGHRQGLLPDIGHVRLRQSQGLSPSEDPIGFSSGLRRPFGPKFVEHAVDHASRLHDVELRLEGVAVPVAFGLLDRVH